MEWLGRRAARPRLAERSGGRARVSHRRAGILRARQGLRLLATTTSASPSSAARRSRCSGVSASRPTSFTATTGRAVSRPRGFARVAFGAGFCRARARSFRFTISPIRARSTRTTSGASVSATATSRNALHVERRGVGAEGGLDGRATRSRPSAAATPSRFRRPSTATGSTGSCASGATGSSASRTASTTRSGTRRPTRTSPAHYSRGRPCRASARASSTCCAASVCRKSWSGPSSRSISRLVAQKGFDLVKQAAGQILETGAFFVALGSGAARVRRVFAAAARSSRRTASASTTASASRWRTRSRRAQTSS